MKKQNNKWKWHFTKDELPEPYKAVVIWVPTRPWESQKVGNGIFYKIAWLEKGKHLESGNNHRPYIFYEFGPDRYFGQEVIAWAYVEELKI